MAQQRTAEAGPQRATGGGDRLPGGGAEPEGEGDVAAGGQVDPGGLHQVAPESVGEGGGQGVVRSSWVSPSLSAPAKPLLTSVNGVEASSAAWTGWA